MKTLVIHPKDTSTDFLSPIYADKDWTIIRNSVIPKSHLRGLIHEHDRIVMLGHGTELGLGRIVMERGVETWSGFMIDSTYVDLLRDKIGVYIWCNANVFVEKYQLKGFYTGMIISEFEEAQMYSVPTSSQWISESNKDFALAIKNSIDEDDMLEKAKLLYEGNSAVVEFNRNNLFNSL